ncbi:MAG TPA: hypothetical protein V6C58_19545 [Allocoleopsis sp.]
MSEIQTIAKSNEQQSNYGTGDITVIQLLQEIQALPHEYWGNLVQIIRLFRESVTSKPVISNGQVLRENVTSKSGGLIMNYQGKIDTDLTEAEILEQQAKALQELTRLWVEEGDEEEQTETWEFLRQALEEDRFKIS